MAQDSKIPSWQLLVNLGNNRLVKSSYYWVVIVPIAAKVLKKLPNEYSFGSLENPITITLGLPFSWEILYFMALSFGIATFIYSYKCPDLLKKFTSWDKFSEKGLGKEQLLVFFSNWLRNHGQIREAGGGVVPQIEAVNTVANKFCSTLPPHLKDIKEAWYLSKYLPIEKEKEIDAFWYIKSLMHNDGKAWRVAASLFYLLGFLLILYLLIINFCFVISVI